MRDEISNKQQIQTTKAYSHILSISGFTFPVPVFLYYLKLATFFMFLLPFKRNCHADYNLFQQKLLNSFLRKSNTVIEYTNINHFMLRCLFNLMNTRY